MHIFLENMPNNIGQSITQCQRSVEVKLPHQISGNRALILINKQACSVHWLYIEIPARLREILALHNEILAVQASPVHIY